jgi:UTP-glucose-1-phosphate uridylyltransferase
VVAWAAYLVGKKPFTNYIILGDDIVIKDDKVAKKYISIMHKLGVSISESKTHVSTDTYEFAKR